MVVKNTDSKINCVDSDSSFSACQAYALGQSCLKQDLPHMLTYKINLIQSSHQEVVAFVPTPFNLACNQQNVVKVRL